MKSLWFKKVNHAHGLLALPVIMLAVTFCHSTSI
jgi:hypothetical protein